MSNAARPLDLRLHCNLGPLVLNGSHISNFDSMCSLPGVSLLLYTAQTQMSGPGDAVLRRFHQQPLTNTHHVIEASSLCLQAAEQRAAAQARGDDGGRGRGRSV